jgi:hypothetical protein
MPASCPDAPTLNRKTAGVPRVLWTSDARKEADVNQEAPATTVEEVSDEELRVHEWRAERLRELGLPWILADHFADQIDWRALADLLGRGCPLSTALQIVR